MKTVCKKMVVLAITLAMIVSFPLESLAASFSRQFTVASASSGYLYAKDSFTLTVTGKKITGIKVTQTGTDYSLAGYVKDGSQIVKNNGVSAQVVTRWKVKGKIWTPWGWIPVTMGTIYSAYLVKNDGTITCYNRDKVWFN